MSRVVWMTDLHLNFPPQHAVEAFVAQVAALEPSAALIGGDLAESPDCLEYLRMLGERLDCPIYFVLGNHDFYFSSIARVRASVREFCRHRSDCVYLSESEPVELSAGVGLVGHDGWADARLGDYARSLVQMHDHRLIEELAHTNKMGRWPILWHLGDEAANHIRRVLPRALQRWRRVVLLTHVPPLHEACWYGGRLSDDQWAPHFTCKAMGDAILEIMPHWPESQLTVLCGHTHGYGECRPLANVQIYTAGAEYGRPEVAQVLEL
jgi:predicted MPP superfamily phosphohydrolase